MKNNSTQNTAPTADQVSSVNTEYGMCPKTNVINKKLFLFLCEIVQLLCHLEHFRRSCRHGNGTGTGLYVQDVMQRALQQAFSNSSDSTKVHSPLNQ